MKSGSKDRVRSRRASLIRATAFLIYSHTHTHTHTNTHTHTKTFLIYQLTSALFMGHWGEALKRGREERG